MVIKNSATDLAVSKIVQKFKETIKNNIYLYR